MKKRMYAKLLAVVAVALACLGCLAPLQAYADDAAAEYKLYPTPHSVVYGDGAQTLRDKASVLAESGIDADTINRLNEALASTQSALTPFPPRAPLRRFSWASRVLAALSTPMSTSW